MNLTLGKFERFVIFCGFVLLMGGLVGILYFVANKMPQNVIALVTPPAPAAPVALPPTTAPAVELVAVPVAVADQPKLSELVFASDELKPDASIGFDFQPWQADPKIEPATQPAAPTTAVKQPEKAAAVAVAASPIVPYEINIAASRVIHMYASEDGSPACWCELKLDAGQLDTLRAAAMKIGQTDHADVDEFDHLAEAPPAADMSLRWWQPAELMDTDLLCVSTDREKLIWIAMSRRTGRTFLYSSRPVAFASM